MGHKLVRIRLEGAISSAGVGGLVESLGFDEDRFLRHDGAGQNERKARSEELFQLPRPRYRRSGGEGKKGVAYQKEKTKKPKK